jgi:phospholipase D1/2
MEARNNYNRPLRRAMLRLMALCVLCAVLLAFWRYSPLGEWSRPEQLGETLNALNAHPWAGPIVVVAFIVGSFLVFPVTALIAATGVALGPTAGMLWASVGSFVAAIVTYGLARALPDHVLDAWAGTWVRRLGKRFENGGIVSVMVARNIPVAPFTLVNVVSGAAGIRFVDYMIGTILGMGPMVAALTVLGDRLRGAWVAPTIENLVLLIFAVAIWILIGVGLQVMSNRLAAQR